MSTIGNQESHDSQQTIVNNSSEPTDSRQPISSETKPTAAEAVAERPFTFSDRPSLEEIRGLHARFVEQRNWDQYHSPRNILLALVGELGELAELFQWRGETTLGLPDWSAGERLALEHELSDVLIYLVRLADRCRVDLPIAVLEKMRVNGEKYPADRVYGSCKKYDEYGH